MNIKKVLRKKLLTQNCIVIIDTNHCLKLKAITHEEQERPTGCCKGTPMFKDLRPQKELTVF